MKKVFKAALCVAVSMFAAMISFSAGAVSSNGINVSETQLRPGDEFTVTIIVPASENADTMTIKTEYDGTVFDTVSWAPELPGGISNSGTGFFVVASANAARSIDLSRGLVLSADLRVKDNAGSGDYTFTLSHHSISYIMDNGTDYKELWEPETTAVAVHIEGNTAPLGNASNEAEQEEEILVEPEESAAPTAETAAPTAETAAPAVTNSVQTPPVSQTTAVTEGKRLNPKTGITAAIVIPAAVTACVILSRRSNQHRKRPKHRNND